jgi:ParB family chromosome partitioning protein
MSTKKRGLGRGLEALLGTSRAAAAATPEETAGEALKQLPVDQLQPGRYQPRTGMDQAKLSELAESIRAQGVIQPIVVREVDTTGKGARYEIIAGERRWRASQLAGLTVIPAVVRVVDDHAVIAMALIENIQREDLNPLEEALALQRLIDEFDLTHAQAAEAVGRSRAAVSNLLRLLELPPDIRMLVETRALEMGHARALLTLAPQAAIALARQAAEHEWSVREVEHRVQQLSSGQVAGNAA